MHRRTLATLVAIVVACLLIWSIVGTSAMSTLATNALESIGQHLWLLFLAIAILPALGIPNCPLMILGGGAAAAVHGTIAATAVAVLAVVANVVWSYWLAAYPLRSFLWQKIESRARTRWLANLHGSDVFRATLLLHVTPGVPLFIQTYFPGLHRLAYWKYLSIAVPVQATYTALIVATSGKIFSMVPASTLTAIGFGSLALICLAGIARDAGWHRKRKSAT